MKEDNKYSNEELVEGVQNKNSRIINYIIKESFPAIKNMVLSNNGTLSDADEVFQEALIVLYSKVKENKLELTCSLSTYLYSISNYKWLQELRRKRPNDNISEAFDLEAELEEDTLYQIYKNERIKLYREKFEELKDECKKVLQMFIMKIPLSEITKIMNYSSEQIARNKRYKCKEALINSIKKSAKYKELVNENIE